MYSKAGNFRHIEGVDPNEIAETIVYQKRALITIDLARWDQTE